MFKPFFGALFTTVSCFLLWLLIGYNLEETFFASLMVAIGTFWLTYIWRKNV